MQPTLDPPDASEYAPYYGKYISLVSGEVMAALDQQPNQTVALLSGLPEERGDHRYSPDKWSIKEVLGHITDSERIFSYRILRIARNDPAGLAGFDQDHYVAQGAFAQRTLADLIGEFAAVRRSTVALLRGLDADAGHRQGIANNMQITVRALVYVTAGHEIHHRRILQERYLAA
jgi:uncharacterized damage-inducible protein DinB